MLAAANLLFWSWSQWIRDDKPGLVAPPALPAGVPASTGAQAADPAACTTIGPLQDEVRIMEIEQLLRDMQLAPARRTLTSDVHDGWWVYLDNANAAAQARSLRLILAAGLRDAFAMPDDPSFKVSVGIFKEEAGARSRAEAVRALGLQPVVGERTRQETSQWFDLPGKGVEAVDMARLASEGVDTQALLLRACMPPEDVVIESAENPQPAEPPAL